MSSGRGEGDPGSACFFSPSQLASSPLSWGAAHVRAVGGSPGELPGGREARLLLRMEKHKSRWQRVSARGKGNNL